MEKRPNKSESYRTLLNMFRQAYGNAPIACLADWDASGITFTILGTEEAIKTKSLPYTSIALGDLLYANATPDWVRLAGNTTTTKKYLSQTGTGTASATPAWDEFTAADIAVGTAQSQFLITGALPYTWEVKTLDQTKTILGINTTDSPTFATVKLTELAPGYIPFHYSDALGLANSEIYYNFSLGKVSIGTTEVLKKLTVEDQLGAAVGFAGLTEASCEFIMKNSSSSRVSFSSMLSGITTNTEGSHTGYLAFYTATAGSLTEKLRILSTGRVSIGATSTNWLLGVHSATEYQGSIYLGNNTPFIQFVHTGTTEGLLIGVASAATKLWGGVVSAGECVVRYPGGKMHFVPNNSYSYPAITCRSNARVGINNSDPDSNLQIGDSVAAGTQLYLHIEGKASDLYFGQSAGTLFGYSPGTAGLMLQNAVIPLVLGNFTNEKLQFGTNNLIRMTIEADGNVGIGVTPEAKLSVNGGAHIGGSTDPGDNNLLVDGTGLFVSTVRTTTSIYRRYYHVALGSANPGASGATWVEAGANTTGGWRLTNSAWLLRGQTDIHSDWDGASNMTVNVKFMVNIDNTGGADADTVDLKLTAYYKGVGDTATKSQTVEVATIVGKSAQYKGFSASFAIDWDAASNVVEVGDSIAFLLNLETDSSEVDDIVIVSMEYFYNTTHIGIESGDT